MHVQIALDVAVGDQHRQFAGLGPVKLLARLAQFGRKDRQIEGPVDIFFRIARHALFVRAIHAIDAVLVDLQAPLLGAPAQCDIVFLRTCEVLQRSAERFARDHAQVNLQIAVQAYRHLGVAARQSLRHRLERRQAIHHLWCIGRDHQGIQITDRFLAAPVAAGKLQPLHSRAALQMLAQRRHNLVRFRPVHALCRPSQPGACHPGSSAPSWRRNP